MWRVAGCRVQPSGRCTVSELMTRASVYDCTKRLQHNAQTPMSQPYDANKEQQSSSTPPPRKSSFAKKVGLVAAAVLVGGGTLLATSEDARLASIDNVPALQSVYDLLGLSTKRNQLPSAPLHQEVDSSKPSIDDKNSLKPVNKSQLKSESVKMDGAAVSSTPEAKNAKSMTNLKSEPSTDSKFSDDVRSRDQALVTTLAEDSVKFLFSGTQTAEELAAIEKNKQEKELARYKSEQQKIAQKQQLAKEKQDAEAAAAIKLKNEQNAEYEKQQYYENVKRDKNQELEQQLSRGVACAVESVEKAITANRLAVEACNKHAEELKRAMDAEKENVAQEYWSKIHEYREMREERVGQATAVTKTAEKDITKILNFISEAKNDVLTKSNPTLNSYKAQVKRLASELVQSTSKLGKMESVDVMKSYFNMLQKDRLNFQRDLEENLPDVQLGNKGSKLTKEELSSLLVFAHQRVLQLKQQLIENEALENLRLQDVLREQQEEIDKEFKEKLDQALSDQEREFMSGQEEELLAQSELHEKKLREELARQHLAHNSHMDDMLKLQRSQLIDQFNKDMADRSKFERAHYVESLTKHTDKINNLMKAVNDKGDIDQALSNAQALMSATQRLMVTLDKEDRIAQRDNEYSVIRLADVFKQLKESSIGCSFVNTIINSIPEKACSSGVYTQSSLERRFENVFNECKKVALNPTTNSVITQRLYSFYSKILFPVEPRYKRECDFVSADGMNTKDLLVQAKYFMERQCLAAAVKCMVQLEGVPRTLAQGWIDEARLLLEVRQAAEALYAHAVSKSLGYII